MMSIKGPSEVTPAYIYESNIHIANILSTLNEQRKCGLLCDITIIVQGIEFKAHKAILASCSSYFNRIITDPANVSHNIVLELSSISKIGMESLLEFAYTSKLAVTSANIDDVICAAHELEFKNIEFSCLNYLKEQLNSGKSSSCFLNSQEASTMCGNSTISRKVELNQKQEKVPADFCAIGGKYAPKPEKQLPKTKDCPLLAKFARYQKKKEVTANQPCPTTYQYDISDKKAEMCEQMTPEQHRALLKQILETHGLETATVSEEKPMEVGASTEVTTESYSACSLQQMRSSCPGGGIDKKRCLTGMYNSDTEGSADEEQEPSACSMMRQQCGNKLRKQPDIKLPFTIDEITSMPRSSLHEVLTQNPNLTQEQICAIHEIRRRGKNRIAAQRCRKRKMECIRSLVAEIEMLRSEHANLMNERRMAREQAQKLSDKFRAKCEKFFKYEKKKYIKQKFCSNSTPTASDSAPLAPEEENLLGQGPISAMSFQEHAERAYELCCRLKEVPCDDLPPCTSYGPSECSSFVNPCLSPPEAEVVVGDASGGDSSDAACSLFQAASPAGSYNESTSAMSPSQRLSDFNNIHISPPGKPAETKTVPASMGTSRTSVVLHTSSVENQGQFHHPLPSLDSIGFNAFPSQTVATGMPVSGSVQSSQLPSYKDVTDGTMNVDFHPQP